MSSAHRAFQPFSIVFYLIMVLGISLGTGTWGAPRAFSQDPPTTTNPTSSVPQEKTIYIPYDELLKVFERDGRGVFLPYDQFQALWKEAQEAKAAKKVPVAALQSLLVSAENIAEVRKDLMVVRSKLRIDLMGKGWHRIPLQLSDSAILSASIDSAPTRVVFDPAAGYQLMLESTKEMDSIVVDIEYAKGIQKTPGQNSVSFAPPLAPINRWRIKVPEQGVKIQVDPMMASSQETGEDPKLSEVSAFVGAAPIVSIRWVPKSETAIGMQALASVQVQHVYRFEEGLLRATTKLQYSIDRSELRELTLRIPKMQKLANVFDPNVKKWSVKPDEKDADTMQVLLVELFEPANKSQALVVETEAALPNESKVAFAIQSWDCIDANRQSGLVGVQVASTLKLEVGDRSGLAQSDIADTPAEWHTQTWGALLRFSTTPYRLQLQLERMVPSIRVAQRVEYVAEPDAFSIEFGTHYTIENAGVFQVEMEVPEDLEILQVKSSPPQGGTEIEIDKYQRDPAKPNRFFVSFKRRAIGSIGLWVQMRKPWGSIDLSVPTEKPFELNLELPRATGSEVQWLEGWAAVYAPDSLRLTVQELSNARPSVANELRGRWSRTCQERHPNSFESLAFSYSMEPAKAKLGIERRRPFVTHRQWLTGYVDFGVIRYTSTQMLNVQYSPIPKWRLDIPASIASDVRVETPGVRESVITPAPADLVEGYVAWELTSDVPWIGAREVRLVWQQKMDPLEVGGTMSVAPARFQPRGVDQASGQIFLYKREGIDLENVKDFDGLRPIDPRYDLYPEMAGRRPSQDIPDPKGAARAFQYQGDWKLDVIATRFALQSISTTNIERAYVRVTATRSHQLVVQAIYRMKNARQRVAIQLPSNAEFDSTPLRINKNAVAMEQGAEGNYFIPLANLDPQQSVTVEIGYSVPGTPAKIPLPIFPDEPSIQKSYLEVEIPREWTLLGTNGRWTDEFSWNSRPGLRNQPVPYQSSNQLKEWVIGDSSQSSTTRSTEQTFLYSTVRPGKDQDGYFAMTTIDSRWLAAMVLASLIALAVAMWRTPWRIRWIVIAMIVSIPLATGLFAPTFSRELLNAPFWVGTSILGLLWGAQSIGNALSHWNKRKPISSDPRTPQASIATDPNPTNTEPSHPADSLEAKPTGTTLVDDSIFDEQAKPNDDSAKGDA